MSLPSRFQALNPKRREIVSQNSSRTMGNNDFVSISSSSSPLFVTMVYHKDLQIYKYKGLHFRVIIRTNSEPNFSF